MPYLLPDRWWWLVMSNINKRAQKEYGNIPMEGGQFFRHDIKVGEETLRVGIELREWEPAT